MVRLRIASVVGLPWALAGCDRSCCGLRAKWEKVAAQIFRANELSIHCSPIPMSYQILAGAGRLRRLL